MSDSGRSYVEDIRALKDAISGDIAICNTHLLKEDAPFWRRATYRTVFSSVEALTAHAKMTVLIFADKGTIFSDAERLALREIEYSIEENGLLAEKKAKIKFLSNVCFTLSCFARMRANGFKIVKTGGWDSLTKAVKVRDRITHPKTAADLIISDVEMRHLDEGWNWFGKALVDAATDKKA
jgi:hypothetical protein